MNSTQRRLVIERDGFQCVACRTEGKTCPYRGKNDEPCKLLAADLLPAVYWKLDANRPAYMRLQVDHIIGRVGGVEVTEAWENVAILCNCCHAAKAKVREIEIAYAATFKGMETPEYLAALAEEAAGFDAKRAKKAKARSASYQKAKEKAGGSPLSKMKGKVPMRNAEPKPAKSKIPSKVEAQNARPVLNGRQPS